MSNVSNYSSNLQPSYQGVQFLNAYVSGLANLATVLDTHRAAQAAVANPVLLKTNDFIALLIRSAQQYDGSRMPSKNLRSKREVNMNELSHQDEDGREYYDHSEHQRRGF